MQYLVIALLFLASHSALAAPALPVNPDVTQANISETICQHGWSASVRPPVSYTNQIKIQLMEREGLPLELIGNQILDHKINISIGGSPDDPRNMALQDASTSREKDRAERIAQRLVCSGQMPLRRAQEVMFNNWEYFLKL